MRLEADIRMIQPEYLGLFFRYPTYWGIVKTNVFGAIKSVQAGEVCPRTGYWDGEE